MEIVAVLVILAIIVYMAVSAARTEREVKALRTVAMQGTAERLGWEFSAAASFDNIPAVRRCELFARGHNRRISNFMSGRRGPHFLAVLDYEYVTGSGRSRRRWEQTVVNVHTPGVAYPRMELRPENVLHRIGGAFGYQDIDLEAHPEFSAAYLLRGPDEAAVRAAVTPAVVEFFAHHPQARAETGGPDLFFWYGSHASPHGLSALLDDALALAARLQGLYPGPEA